MCQDKIIKVLKKKEGLTARELADGLKIGYSCVLNSLRKLRKYNEVKFKQDWDRGNKTYRYFL